jgi:intein/homing endonuclease
MVKSLWSILVFFVETDMRRLLFGIFGRLGDGKTLALTYLTFEHWFKRREKIYSNYHLFKMPYYYINGVNQLDIPKGTREQPVWLSLDEFWRIIKARTPMLKQNDIVYDILGRSRKRAVQYGFTSQLKSSMDKNVVQVLDFISKPSLTPDNSLCRLDIFAGAKASAATLINSPRFWTAPFMQMYNSVTGDQDIFFYDDSGFHIEKIGNFDENRYRNVKILCVNLKTLEMELKPLKAFLMHFVHKDGYEIKTQYGRMVKVTGDHSIFVLKKDFKALSHAFKKGRVSIESKEARKLTTDDYIAIPKDVPVIEKDIDRINVADIVYEEMDGLKHRYDYSLQVSVGKDFIKNNYEPIKTALKDEMGNHAFKRLYLFKRKNYLPYRILKEIGIFPDRMKISSRYLDCMIENDIKLDGDIMWLLGFYVAEGARDCQDYYLRFYSEKRFIDKAKNIISEKFGIDMKSYREMSEIKGVVDLSLSNRAMIILFRELTKDLSWIVQLPKSKLKYFLQGWWDGDGCHNGNAIKFIISTSNKNLANPLISMLNRFGLIAGINRAKSNGFDCYHIVVSGISKEKVNDVLSWDIGIEQNLRCRKYKDLIFAKVKEIKTFKIDDYVYDLSVEGNHSFLAGNHIIAKNSEEEIDMESEIEGDPPLIFQPYYIEEHGFCCECEKCGTKFFKTWEEADLMASQWWEKHWKEVLPDNLMQGEEE